MMTDQRIAEIAIEALKKALMCFLEISSKLDSETKIKVNKAAEEIMKELEKIK